MSERKERRIIVGPMHKNLSVQLWEESRNWWCNPIKWQYCPCFDKPHMHFFKCLSNYVFLFH
jgi:hypothetical protein